MKKQRRTGLVRMLRAPRLGGRWLRRASGARGAVGTFFRRRFLRLLGPFADHPWLKADWFLQRLPPFLRERIPPFLEMPPLQPEGQILPHALTFQGALTHLVQEPLPPGLRGTIRWCATAIGLALLVSILFKVDVVVSGQGKLTYDSPPIVLQPFERAVLRELHVKPGDRVTKGQVLATLDPTFSQADLSALDSRHNLTRSLLRRLECEASARAYVPEAQEGEAGELQLEIHKQRMAEYASRLRAFEESLGEIESGLTRVQNDKKNLESQLEIFNQMEEMQEKLFKVKTNSQLEYLAARSSRLRAEREFSEATERLVELRHRGETVQAQKQGFQQEWRRTLLEEMNRQRAEQAQIDSVRAKTLLAKNFIVITAPEEGIVLDLANRSVGSILREAEPLVILIPTSVPMISEILLGSSLVGEAAVGDPVLIKVDAYSFQRYGGMKGRIRSISHESHTGGGGTDLESVANKRAVSGGMHRVAIELETLRPENLPEHRKVFPGMTVTGEIHLGKRRIINYILLPLLRGLNESFREP